MLLANISASAKKIAPPKTELIIKILCSLPKIFLIMCGIINPIKPIVPAILTETEVISEAQAIIANFSFSTFTPLELAISSPIDKRFKAGEWKSKNINPRIT